MTIKSSYAEVNLNLLDWEPTGDFDDGDPRSRLHAPLGTLSFMGVFMHVEAWEIELLDEDKDDLNEVYRPTNWGLRDDFEAAHAAFMQDGRFRLAEVQFPDETTPRLYVVFAFPHGD